MSAPESIRKRLYERLYEKAVIANRDGRLPSLRRRYQFSGDLKVHGEMHLFQCVLAYAAWKEITHVT